MSNPILDCINLNKIYHDGIAPIEVLKSINLTIKAGDSVAIVGPSGSGKSTLLHLLGGLDKPSSGDVKMLDISWQSLSEKRRCQLRNQQLGFIYQFHHLLPEFTALENVAMTLLLGATEINEAKEAAASILTRVGLGQRLHHKPAQLSGGERQRVAIARALIHKPHCVLADEPTGNLDQATAQRVFEMMLELNSQLQTALVIVTHDPQLANRMNRVLTIQEGILVV